MAQDRPVETLRVGELSDAELQSSVESALERDVFSPDTVSATVHNGVVTLEGEVTWIFERDAAERTVQFLKGVAAVNNTITIKPQTSALQVKVKIQSALQRQATNDANSIHVETSGATVTLTGHASSWQAIEAAASAARAVAGVTTVIVLVKMRMTY
jgi:VCBS repeat-containing protein